MKTYNKTVIKYISVIEDFIQDRKDRIIKVIDFKKTNIEKNSEKDNAFLDSIMSQYEHDISMAEKDIDYVKKNTKHAYDYYWHYTLKLKGICSYNEACKRYSI